MNTEEEERVPVLAAPTYGHLDEPTEKTRSPLLSRQLLLCAALSCVCTACVGVDIGFTSSALPDLNERPNPFHLNLHTSSLAASILALGCLLGAPLCGLASDLFGRQRAMLWTTLPTSLSWLLLMSAPNAATFVAGRFLTGFFSGFLETLPIVYMCELAPAALRGRLTAALSVSRNLGIVYSYTVGAFFHWNYLALFSSALVTLVAVLAALAGESPRYLLLRGRVASARRALRWLRDGDEGETETELAAIRQSLQQRPSGEREEVEKSLLSVLSSRHFYRPCAIIFSLLLCTNGSGTFLLIYYCLSIFHSTSTYISIFLHPHAASVTFAIMCTAGSVTCGLVADRCSRRLILAASATFDALCLATVALYFRLMSPTTTDAADTNDAWSLLPLVALMLFAFCSRAGIGTVTFVLIGELFPARLRGLASGLCGAWHWVLVFATTECFPYASDAFGLFPCFAAMALVSLCGAVFSVLCVPETRGKSLEDIDNMFGR